MVDPGEGAEGGRKKGKRVKSFTNPYEGGEPLPYELKTKIEDSLRKMGCDTSDEINTDFSRHSQLVQYYINQLIWMS